MTSESGPGVELGPVSLAGSEPTVAFSGPRRPPPPRLARRPRRNLSGSWQEGNRAIAVVGLPRLFEASVCSGLSEDSNGAQGADPLHAIHGTPPRTLLLQAFAAGQSHMTTARVVPLLSPAVPWSMPQTCPKRHLCSERHAPPRNPVRQLDMMPPLLTGQLNAAQSRLKIPVNPATTTAARSQPARLSPKAHQAA
jgi:hypothetical protein